MNSLEPEEIPSARSSTWRRLPDQFAGRNPFGGDSVPSRVSLFGRGRPSLPFPHPWNYTEPLRILETFFHGADGLEGAARDNRYLDVPGFSPVLVTRDREIIRAILSATGDKPGQFDRDTMPSAGIARATGADTLLYANGPLWRLQKKLSAPPFSKSQLFQPEKFHEFEQTFRKTVQKRLQVLADILRESGQTSIRITLEDEIKVVMLEMLVNNFFGADVAYEELRDRYVPSLVTVIDYIVRDTVRHRIGWRMAGGPEIRQAKADFETLTDVVLAPRKEGLGLWAQFKSDASDEALRSNIRVFLAGALEATTSFASWALSHLSHHPEIQEALYDEVREMDVYDPDNLKQSVVLNRVLEETLRLTPSLYFLPRRATVDTTVETSDGRTMTMPQGTHVLLDVWHANRCEAFWGKEATGYPAGDFAPARWEALAQQGRSAKDVLHFGFGHGPRVCPGKFLGLLEAGLVVGAGVKVFRIRAVNESTAPKAGVSTKPADGVLVDLELR